MQIKTLSVSQINNYIKRVLSSNPILSYVHIKGEISNYKFHRSGHIYFSLKDEESKINCVMFKTYAQNLKLVPNEGMEIVAKGSISVYERDGQYQLYVTNIESCGIGKLYENYIKLKIQLEKEGAFDPKKKKQIPYLPRKIALITSPTGAAIIDMISIIKRRFPSVEIYVFPVQVQGEGAAQSIAKGIELCNRIGKIDVAIVGRGGGAVEELWAFNEEITARSILKSDIPIISAVGHETDITIADFVADVRAATPSAAAEIVVPNQQDLKNYLQKQKNRLQFAMMTRLGNRKNRLKLIQENYYFKNPLNYINENKQKLDYLRQIMIKSIKVHLETRKIQLKNKGERINSLNPLSILSRGYAIAKTEQNKVITSVENIKEDDIIKVDVVDGEIRCKVKQIVKERNTFGTKEI